MNTKTVKDVIFLAMVLGFALMILPIAALAGDIDVSVTSANYTAEGIPKGDYTVAYTDTGESGLSDGDKMTFPNGFTGTVEGFSMNPDGIKVVHLSMVAADGTVFKQDMEIKTTYPTA